MCEFVNFDQFTSEIKLNNQELEKRKHTHLSTDAKEIVLNVYSGLKKELSASEAMKETVFLTKVPQSTVYKIIKEGPQSRKVRQDAGLSRSISKVMLEPIREAVYGMFAANNYPSLDSLFLHLQEKMILEHCHKTTLWRFLRSNGFKFKTIDKRQTIMESSRLVKWRMDYLDSLAQCRRDGRDIYFLDETWYDTHDIVKKCWTDGSSKCKVDTPPSRGKRICILHCGGELGWVEGALLLSAKDVRDSSLDYHQDIESTLFEQWFQHTLIPKLKPNSVIVLDNAPYHSRFLRKKPNSNSTKSIIQDFLIENDIYFEENYTKKQLVELLKVVDFKSEFVIDNIATSYGFQVLRLPPYYCILNPIELIWSQIKMHCRRNNSSPKCTSSVIETIRNACNGISIDNWKNAIKHVKQIEDKYMTFNNTIQKIVINLEDSDDSDIPEDEHSDCESEVEM